ncbi:sulfurtransferase [Acidihalobacter aeolianus]|uniref:Sulfurtransferase n=1 Tax=Acidihalobacter aeolianus TaxID=2792603 RepID=A0A1D8K5S5_9GAMM|nr:rhodanese-like domain-containing protein [Acidihalobacter aeolianus]AOV16309.1 sulfurtransferase [Acidihalobacter aeolianus]
MHKTLADFITDARSRVTDVSADDLAEWLEERVDELLLIDTREPYEYARSHIPGALLIPRGLIESAADPNNARRVSVLCEARDKTIVLYCDTGGRSTLAADNLQLMGFSRVLNLAGGLKLWDAEDYATESGEYTLPLP